VKNADIFRMKRREDSLVDAATVASNHTLLSTIKDSNQEVLAAFPQVDSKVATLLKNEPASNQELLATTPAINQTAPRRKKVFTSAGKTQVNVRMERHLKAKLDILAAASGKALNDLVVEGIQQLLATSGATLLATYDLDDVLIQDPIIQLYVRYTGRSFTEADKTSYEQVRHLNPLVIRVGVLATLIRKQGGQINSFAYFLPEIQNAATQFSTMAAPVDYVKYLDCKVRQKYKK